jgi:hypothetical protein
VSEFLGRDEIDLVEDLDDGLGRDDSKLGEDFLNLDLLLVADGAGGILDVEENLGALHLFEGGAEAGDEGMGKVADEADRIGEQDLAARGKLELAELGVEGSEHAGGLEHAGLGESVEEGALSGVGVADEGDYRDGDCFAALALLMADATDAFELGLDVVEAEVDLAAVGLKLGLSRAAGSDAAAKLGHGAASTSEAGELVFELGEFYLKLAFAGLGVAGEDVKDELGAVDDVAGETGFDVAELRGRQVVVEEDERGVGGGDDRNDLFELALADEAGGIGLLAALDESGGDGGTGGSGEFLELRTAGVEVEGGGGVQRRVVFRVETGDDSGGGAG